MCYVIIMPNGIAMVVSANDISLPFAYAAGWEVIKFTSWEAANAYAALRASN